MMLTNASSSRILLTWPQTTSPTRISKHLTGNLFSTKQALSLQRSTPMIDAKTKSLQRQRPCWSYYWLYLANFWPTCTRLFRQSFINQYNQEERHKMVTLKQGFYFGGNGVNGESISVFIGFPELNQYYRMITRLSRLFHANKNLYFFAVPKPTIKAPPPKVPTAKPKANELSLSMVSQQLNINEESLRKQLLNPKTNFVNKEEVRMLSIINGVELPQKAETELPYKKKSPVITIMGHVDHGKTTLIDYLRNSSIAQGEVGGITQKIGAFHITCHGQKITFIDTPGHEAFSNMRRRGARVTDLIVLIVASTEGVKKQTQEVIDLIIKDKIPTIVAISKIDLPNADVEATENSIFQAGLNIEPRGGDIPVVHISAKTGQNVELLSQLILEQTKDLKTIEDGFAEGIVLEAYQNSKGLNAMTMIVKQGTLKVGSLLVIGEEYAKVKSLHDDKGDSLKVALPGDAVQVVGIPNIPAAGDFIYEVSDQNKAKFITTKRKQISQQALNKDQEKNTVRTAKIRLDYRSRKAMYGSATNEAWLAKFAEKENEIVEKIQEMRLLASTNPKFQELIREKQEQLANHKQYVYQFLVNIGMSKSNFNVIIRSADRGVEETIHEQIQPIIQRLKEKNEITVNVIKSDIGEVTANDIEEAATCSAEIFTFGVQVNAEALEMQKAHKLVPKVHRLIHNFLKDFEESAIARKKGAMIKGVEKGRGVVADVFKIKGKKPSDEPILIPGVRVSNGKIAKTHKMYVFRNGTPITEELFPKSIKIFKKETAEIKIGDQCTITLDFPAGFTIEKGDQIVAFEQ